jgi:hypothetical protein
MYYNVKKFGIVTAPTHIYRKKKKIAEYSGENYKFLTLSDIGKTPCSFHPFLKKTLARSFEEKSSQDVYNIALYLNQNKIKMVNNVYYILNLNNSSYTSKKNYSHIVNMSYKYYQLKSIKKKQLKLSQQFAYRRIINNKYEKWKIMKRNKSFYDFLKEYKYEK